MFCLIIGTYVLGWKKNRISHRTNLFASHPSLCGGGYMRYQLWISTNIALTGLLQISCMISKDNANRNTLKKTLFRSRYKEAHYMQRWRTWYFLQHSYERKSVVWRKMILWPGCFFSLFFIEFLNKINIGYRTNFFASSPFLCRGGYMR
jgi:hypothetical protein